jgi:hypothetical protein
MTIAAAAVVLNVAPSTLHRWLNDGLIGGEQVTPGAPWRIRMTDELKARFTASADEGFITMQEATRSRGSNPQQSHTRPPHTPAPGAARHLRCGQA